jgi:hypothetical protein
MTQGSDNKNSSDRGTQISDSQILDRIRDSFSRLLDRRTFAVWSFVKELATAGVGKVYISPEYECDLRPNTHSSGRVWGLGRDW